MKKVIALMLALVCVWGLCGCSDNPAVSTAQSEVVSAEYGKAIELARAEFAAIFKAFTDVQIEETSTMVRTDDDKELVVQFRYASGNGNGVYGFLYRLDDAGHPELIQHGEDVTIDNLLK